MYNRFTDIIVGLQNHGDKLEPVDLNRKLLESLPIEWRPKVTAIEEAKNLNTITIEESYLVPLAHMSTLLTRIKGKRKYPRSRKRTWPFNYSYLWK